MATAAQAQALISAVTCAYCLIPIGMLPYVQIAQIQEGNPMATAADAQALLAEATCLKCVIPAGMAGYALLAALIDKVNGNPVPEDPQELLAEATCLRCIPEGMVPYAIAYELGQLP